MKKNILDYFPKTKVLIEAAKDNKKPTIEERVEALEMAMLEQIMEGVQNV